MYMLVNDGGRNEKNKTLISVSVENETGPSNIDKLILYMPADTLARCTAWSPSY